MTIKFSERFGSFEQISSGRFTPSIQVAASGGGTIYTASDNEIIMTDTATNDDIMTVKLPLNAVAGDRVMILDGKDDWSNNNVTVDRNGHNIDGAASDFTCNVNGGWVEFIYMDSTEGWRTLV